MKLSPVFDKCLAGSASPLRMGLLDVFVLHVLLLDMLIEQLALFESFAASTTSVSSGPARDSGVGAWWGREPRRYRYSLDM